MDYDYLARIKASITLYTRKKTSNILDGEFGSIYRGRSFDFDDLREYVYGDSVRDIDWKSSSKTGRVLIRRYIADKKHNILFVGDAGAKFKGDTDKGEAKTAIALNVLGTISYLVNDHGDDYALLTSTDKGYDFSFFKSGKQHLERLLMRYEKCLAEEEAKPLSGTLDYIAENIRRKMIIFIITDMDGIAQIDETLVKKLTVMNDVMVINVEDAYLTGDNLYDLDAKNYEKDYLLHDKKLHKIEVSERAGRKKKANELFKKYQISMVDVSREDEVVDKIVELFERHKNENVG
ncbi:MAG: DUF58 domain-containing protein [Eubacterium sp.]|jgi:uncharacterized protein (DUF58 family)|nr:DUF58 domain-containing protein [Eubacterium sp.]MBQ2054495.1 DUF58 domain-containing protein [Eubacterium sp.]